MSERLGAPPFPLGETWYGIGGTPVNADTHEILGKEWVFEDPIFRNKFRRMRCVRNVSGINLLPKMAVTYKTSAANDPCGFETEVDGYSAVTATRVVLVDDRLPAAGVANNDVFWVCVEGEHLGITAKGGLNSILVGDFLESITAAASTFSTTAGRLQLQDLTGATAVLGVQILNTVGHAMTAQTTNNTDTDIRVNVRRN
jgi:hypothetical protein